MQTKTKPLAPVPTFSNEAEERAYWECHDSTAHIDWAQAHRAALPSLKPSSQTLFLQLPQHLLDGLAAAALARQVQVQSLIEIWLQEKLQGQSRLPLRGATVNSRPALQRPAAPGASGSMGDA